MTSSNKDRTDDLYYFESDNLALKGNTDYGEVLKILLILDAQRKTAIKDYAKIIEIKQKMLENPFKAIEMLKNGTDLGIPPMHELPKLPKIDFSKYNVKIPEDILKQIYTDNSQPVEEGPQVEKEENKNEDPADTFNKPWTFEEQKKLEALLTVYPSEAIESRRFKKIAAALGTRTTKQVTSRVQKYFRKLLHSGLPIPGRIPKSEKYHKKVHKHQRHNHYLMKATTFFPHLSTPVTMNDSAEPPVPLTIPNNSVQATSSNYLMDDVQVRETRMSQIDSSTIRNASRGNLTDRTATQLNLIERIKQEKESATNATQQYVDYKCIHCGEDIHARWRCTDCTNYPVYFCSDCLLDQIHSDHPHPPSHHFELYYSNAENTSDSESSSNRRDNLKENLETSDSDDYEDKTPTYMEVVKLKKELNHSVNLQTLTPEKIFNEIRVKEESNYIYNENMPEDDETSLIKRELRTSFNDNSQDVYDINRGAFYGGLPQSIFEDDDEEDDI